MRLHSGPGFFIGLALLPLYAAVAVGMAYYALVERAWVVAILALGVAWVFINALKAFIGWHSIRPHSEVQVGSGGLTYDNRFRLCAGIAVISFGISRVKKSVNFLPAGMDHSAVARLVFRDGTELRFRAGQGPFTIFAPFSADLGRRDVEQFLLKLDNISNFARTAPQVVSFEDIVR